MPYKDKALQRETTKTRVRRYRKNQKALQESDCLICNALTTERHHVSYEPEITIALCHSCHSVVTGDGRFHTGRHSIISRYEEIKKQALHKGVTSNPVQPKPSDIKSKLEKAGLNLEGNRILGAVQSKSSPVESSPSTNLPRYNPAIHRPGDTVLVLRGKRWLPYLIPEVDASGQAIPDYW